jgi:HlyD family secretion protein
VKLSFPKPGQFLPAASVQPTARELQAWLAKAACNASSVSAATMQRLRAHLTILKRNAVRSRQHYQPQLLSLLRDLRTRGATGLDVADRLLRERVLPSARHAKAWMMFGYKKTDRLARKAWGHPRTRDARERLTVALEETGRWMPGPPVRDLQIRLAIGLVTVALLVFGIGGWMATAQLSGAVVANGLIVVDSNVKKVQHPTGGVVSEIKVKNGDRVNPLDLLVRLDDTQTRAALGIIVSQLVELHGRKARLIAERDDLDEVSFPKDLEAYGDDGQRVMAGERRLFESRQKVAQGQKAQLKERIGQLRQEIEGLTSQRDAKSKELKLVREEFGRVDDMHKRGLLPVTRVLAMEREETRIAGEHGAFIAQIARTSGQIAETELSILAIDQTMRTDAQKELRETEARIAELSERRLAAEDQLKRIDIRSPLAGIVHDLSVHTVGGVIAPGEAMMQIVPTGEMLSVEVRIPPHDIDQLALGQKAMLRFTAFNQRTTPELSGALTHVAADLTREAQSGMTYYLARIKLSDEGLAKLAGVRLLPGMPVEAFIETGHRTALSYFLKPFSDQLARTFRER